jgi:hypothetical protein
MPTSRITSLLLAGLCPALLLAQDAQADLRQQIEALKQQVSALEAKANEQEQTLNKVETKVAQDNIAWGGNLTTRFDGTTWHLKPYQQFLGFSGAGGVPAPMLQQIPGQDLKNSVEWTTKLSLHMTIPVNENAKIMGRLTMYKIAGGGGTPIFNGNPNTVQNSFSSVQVPSSDVLHVERASLVYDWPKLGVLSIGRQNTTDGPPLEVKAGTERQATPQAIMVNAEVDGIGWKFHLDKLFDAPEHAILGLCYGVGYESGFGGGGQVASSSAVVGYNFSTGMPQSTSVNGLKDTTVFGAMLDLPLLGEAFGTVHAMNFYLGYNRLGNMVDIPNGSLMNFPLPQGVPGAQTVTATNNLGDMDQWGATWKHKVGDQFTYFVSGGYIKSHPNGKASQYGAYMDLPSATLLTGFGGLLGDPKHSQSGTCLYLGMRYDPTPEFGFGVEFNHGSPNWYTYSPAAGESDQKLAARGDVWEGYGVWNFARNAFLRLGYIEYHYTHAFSGWHIAPGPMANFNLDNDPVLQYASPSSVKDYYASIEVRF